MCTDCGCGLTDGNRHLVAHDHDHAHGHAYRPRHGRHEDGGTLKALTEHNDRHARANRAAFDRHRVAFASCLRLSLRVRSRGFPL